MALADYVDVAEAIRCVSEGTCPYCKVQLKVEPRAWCDKWREADLEFNRRMGGGLPVPEAGFCGRCESFWFVMTQASKPAIGSLPNFLEWEPGAYAATHGAEG